MQRGVLDFTALFERVMSFMLARPCPSTSPFFGFIFIYLFLSFSLPGDVVGNSALSSRASRGLHHVDLTRWLLGRVQYR